MVRYNYLSNKYLAECLRIEGYELATVRISTIGSAMLSNNSL